VPYPGASASDIEQSVTIKIEQEMQGLGQPEADPECYR
jgi:multidrug efflux pump subunit AcrB